MGFKERNEVLRENEKKDTKSNEFSKMLISITIILLLHGSSLLQAAPSTPCYMALYSLLWTKTVPLVDGR